MGELAGAVLIRVRVRVRVRARVRVRVRVRVPGAVLVAEGVVQRAARNSHAHELQRR